MVSGNFVEFSVAEKIDVIKNEVMFRSRVCVQRLLYVVV